jgi:hypothetical protein
MRYARFESPDRPINATRFRSVGLKPNDEPFDTVPGSAVPDDDRILPGQQHANEEFYGIRSRSRFFALLTPPPVGHGGPSSGVTPGRTWKDPGAGRSQFDDRFVEPFRDDLSASSVTNTTGLLDNTPSLGQEDVGLARKGVLRFARPDYGAAPVNAQPIVGPPSWYAAGPIPVSLRMSRRGTLRREFMQWAQTFLGRHSVQVHTAPGSTSPVRMAAARTNRLTERRLPASFGATTEVLQ